MRENDYSAERTKEPSISPELSTCRNMLKKVTFSFALHYLPPPNSNKYIHELAILNIH